MSDEPADAWGRDAALYDEHWQPVLDAAVQRLLDRVEGLVGGDLSAEAPGSEAPMVLDLGTGSGALLVAAARRWPGLRFSGLDRSPGMLARAVDRATAAGLPGPGPALVWLAGDAAALPLRAATVRLVLSSFVLQLVADRRRVLAEVRRVLRPGGWLAFVSWLVDDVGFAADAEFDEAVLDLDIEEPEVDETPATAGDFESLEQVRSELAAAGFSDVTVELDTLVHAWDRGSYLRFKEAYDERALFGSLGTRGRDRLVTRVRERWAALPDDAFVMRAPLVSALARRP